VDIWLTACKQGVCPDEAGSHASCSHRHMHKVASTSQPVTHTLTCSLTRSLTHLRAHSLTCGLTCSLDLSHNCAIPNSLNHIILHSLNHQSLTLLTQLALKTKSVPCHVTTNFPHTVKWFDLPEQLCEMPAPTKQM